ncbi:MAG: M12 family metallopeptidase [Phycisphaerales bacterium]
MARTLHAGAYAVILLGLAVPVAGQVAPQGVLLRDLTPGYVLVEGDIQVRLDRYLAVLSGAEATFGPAVYWGLGIVPYAFAANVSAANQQAMLNTMAMIEQRAGVDFREHGGDPNWIVIQDSAFNNSPVGVQGGWQIINIADWGNPIIMAHELYHSLGFRHEQSRPDRDTFVTINTGNICGAAVCPPGTGAGQCCACVNALGQCISCDFNFAIRSDASTFGPYDFDSFMHYGRADFSCNGMDTITVNTPWNTQWQNAIGQRDHFSYLDAVVCRGLYPFDGDRWLDPNYFGVQVGTMLQPWNDTFATSLFFTPVGGTLWIKPGNYSAVGVYASNKWVQAPAGGVVLGN